MQTRGNEGPSRSKFLLFFGAALAAITAILYELDGEVDQTAQRAALDANRFFSATNTNPRFMRRPLHPSPTFEVRIVEVFVILILTFAFLTFMRRIHGTGDAQYEIPQAPDDPDLQRAIALSLAENQASDTLAKANQPVPEISNYEARVAAAGYQDEVPSWMEDPITSQIMHDPKIALTTLRGTEQTFDQSTLDKIRLDENNVKRDPFSRQPIIDSIPNKVLKDAIEYWIQDKEQHPKGFAELNCADRKKSLLKSQALFRERLSDENKKIKIQTASLKRSYSFNL